MAVNKANPNPKSIYPNLEEDNSRQYVDQKLYFITRQQEMRDKRNELEKELKKYRKLYKRCRKFNNVDYLTTSLMTAATGLSITSVATTGTGIGAVIGLPTGIVGASSAGVSGMLKVLSIFAHRKEIKYIVLKEKCYEISKEFNALLHKANADSVIDEKEYNSMIEKYDEYIQFKNNSNKDNRVTNETKN